jgi:hypothetical protein
MLHTDAPTVIFSKLSADSLKYPPVNVRSVPAGPATGETSLSPGVVSGLYRKQQKVAVLLGSPSTMMVMGEGALEGSWGRRRQTT